MSNLANISIDDIKKELYKVLIINENNILNQYQLYEKVIDYFDIKSTFVDNKFKLNFIISLQELPTTYNDIYVTCDIKNKKKLYNAIYKCSESLEEINNIEIEENHNLLSDTEILQELVNNDDLNYIDMISGNNIIHDSIITENNLILSLLLDSDINSNKLLSKNNFNKSPISYIKSGNQQITNTILEHALKNIKNLENKLNTIEIEKFELKINIKNLKDEKLYLELKIKTFIIILIIIYIYYYTIHR